jgi:chromosomal replication initiator protein
VDNLTLPNNLPATWNAISAALKQSVTADTFSRWFRDAQLVALTEKEATLQVPNNIYQLWIETNFSEMLRAAITVVVGSPRTVRFVCLENPPVAQEPVEEDFRSPAIEATPASAGNGMNGRFTFDSFVVGKANEYAHAACFAVAKSPAKTYNPLFIYGGVGLGKTHLMHATGQHIAGPKRGAKVVYVTSEQFTNEFIEAIRDATLVKFRKRYRLADVLLIDDIQFLAGKERSQEEFFHTFNTLFDGNKQIVLSSDRPPSEIADLSARLVSRFEWGLTAELQPPDVETRSAILRKKAAELEVAVAPRVLEFLANRVRSNVRRLEGALVRVASFVSLTRENPSDEKIEHLLKDIFQEEARRAITIEQIQKRVAEQFDLRFADMTSKRRPANIAFPRQVAMYLARELTKGSLSEIGDAFGGRDHGTVLHAHRLVKERIKNDEKIRQTVSMLNAMLQR